MYTSILIVQSSANVDVENERDAAVNLHSN